MRQFYQYLCSHMGPILSIPGHLSALKDYQYLGALKDYKYLGALVDYQYLSGLKDYQYLGALVDHEADRVSEAIACCSDIPACIDHINLGLHLQTGFEMHLLAFEIF